jgi:hypothetical protein
MPDDGRSCYECIRLMDKPLSLLSLSSKPWLLNSESVSQLFSLSTFVL